MKDQYEGGFKSFVVTRASKDENGRGRPPILQNEDLRAIVEQNPQQSVREMSMQLGLSISTVSDYLNQIGKVKKLEK